MLFAKQSKGHASIYSEVGKGTTVRIFLPRALSGEDAAALEDIKTPTPCRGHERLLIVEDNERVRDTPSAILRANG